MISERRGFGRFEIPIILEYRDAEGGLGYSWGLTRNFSCEGLCFESLNSDFEPKQTLEIKLKFPRKGTFVSVLGDIVWKGQARDKWLAGIKLREMDEASTIDLLKKVSAYVDMPVARFFSGFEPENVATENVNQPSEKVFSSEQHKLRKLTAGPARQTIQKEYLGTGGECRVTFVLPRDAAPEAQKASVVGDFNGWDEEADAMQKLENGDFVITLELKAGSDYRFRYLIDGSHWENDWNADGYVPNTFGGDDSVVSI